MAQPVGYRVVPNDGGLLRCIESVASETDRPRLSLRLQALLQLPRIADQDGYVSPVDAASLIRELALELPQSSRWRVQGSIESPRVLLFHEVEEEEATRVMHVFHYLRSPRTDGRSFGLYTQNGALVALAMSSPLDVPRIQFLLDEANARGTARVISRVFAYDGAPRNTISYLLARIRSVERSMGSSDLVTYVNPNMGFGGASYRASGWTILGTEPGTTYKYLDERYITDRQLVARLGTQQESLLREILGARFATSAMELLPLTLFRISTAALTSSSTAASSQ